ncbi:Antibiotic biosynthesis monooxygenase (modular protein) [Cupriavidus necator]|uniref:Antibiotic biosynthesis monooxygenase (Modular protein) n=1 Tax=Cupriavidus necator TaxID=106590 RepID=A0A1K0JKQ9_CUPNE|nr:Antibiotic biosynthesis monooxygenase (modular protein) [Cupriavidus necator]
MRGIVAKIKVKEGREAEFEVLANGLVTESRREAGCLSYDLWRSDEAREYVFIERYGDEAAAQAHVKSDHYRRIGRQMGALMDGVPTVFRLALLESDAGVATADQVHVSDGYNDSARAMLVARWLNHFGVDDARRLDLGTLGAIQQYVENGVPPPERAA